MQLHEKYKDKVACMTLSLDYQGDDDEPPESFLMAVERILKEKGVKFLSIICSDDYDTVIEKSQVFIPAVLVYDQSGKLHRFEGEGSYKEKVFPLLEKLLSSSS
ncbi:MAG: hypothetical protein IH991_14835 [Planctomycetes bacterium]|nr:hypothetical protein [Planctomycetota bacterium]